MDYYRGKLSLSDSVYNQILEKISSGEWKVGDKIPSENTLCKMFGVSRTSVRAALQNLQGKNILVTMQGIGSFVQTNPSAQPAENATGTSLSDISSNDFQEFFEFRQAIEFKAIEFFVRRATPEDDANLKIYLDQMIAAGEEEDKEAFTKFDYEFHMAIIKGARNMFLYQTMMQNKEIFYHYLGEITRLTDKPLSILVEEHIELYTYLVEKKPKLAKDYLFCDNTYYHVTYFNR